MGLQRSRTSACRGSYVEKLGISKTAVLDDVKIVRAGPSSLRRYLSIPRRKHHESCDSVKHSKHFQTCRLHWRHYYRDHQHRGDAERDAHDGCNLFVHRRELHSVERLTKSRFFNDVIQTSSVRDFFLYCQSEAAHATRTAFVSFIFHSEAWAACEAAYSCMRCARTDDPAHSRASRACLMVGPHGGCSRWTGSKNTTSSGRRRARWACGTAGCLTIRPLAPTSPPCLSDYPQTSNVSRTRPTKL